MLILVNGLYTYNSGKTTVGRALLREMALQGMRPMAFKGMSAHNFWDHLSHSRRCEELGKLVSRDALLLSQAAQDSSPMEIVNPHHQLLCPLDPLKVLEERAGMASVPADDEILMERFTDGSTGESTLSVHPRANRFQVPEGFVERLSRGAHRVDRLAPLATEKRSASATKAVETCYARIATEARPIVAEATNDLILPSGLASTSVDLVVTVAASVLLCYDSANFFRPAKVVKSHKVRDFIGYAEPVLGYRLPLLTEPEVADIDTLHRHFRSAVAGVVERALRGSSGSL